MSRRNKMSGRTRKLLIGVTAATLAGTAFAVSTGLSSAGENCAGLDQALRNNIAFINEQNGSARDALSDARIANRQAVVDLINQRRATAGCTEKIQAAPVKAPTKAAPSKAAPSKAAPIKAAPTKAAPTKAAGNAAGGGEVVCKGSTVTLSGEAGVPAASSGTFPIGTTLKVTNLDNNKSITVKVATPSGSCILLNNAAFEEVREAGKFLIRRAVIERVG